MVQVQHSQDDEMAVHNVVSLHAVVNWKNSVVVHRGVPTYAGVMDDFHLTMPFMIVPPLDLEHNPEEGVAITMAMRRLRERAERRQKREELEKALKKHREGIPSPVTYSPGTKKDRPDRQERRPSRFARRRRGR